jgi:hypothetical protein
MNPELGTRYALWLLAIHVPLAEARLRTAACTQHPGSAPALHLLEHSVALLREEALHLQAAVGDWPAVTHRR